jgi:hypothetical protein
MKLFLTPALCLISTVTAYPGMGKTLKALQSRQKDGEFDSNELIGDLATLQDKDLKPVGRSIKNIITDTGGDKPESNETWDTRRLPAKGTPQCAKDTCCIWQYVANDMAAAFRGKSGRCTDLARGAVRMGFHDCGTWSKATGIGGGCDGSLLLAQEEMSRTDNRGLEEIAVQMRAWYDAYKGFGVGMADLIQMGANVATVVCPLGPRVRSYVGRKDSGAPSPKGLLPGPFQPADVLIELFENKTIRPHGLTALLGAHTTSQQRFVDESRAGDPQDSTPGVWDVLFYKQTLGAAPARVFKFASDVALSVHPKTAPEWKEFAGPGGQDHWNEVR